MAVLPTGTVTFLFTDIEGSTKLAQAHPVEWESARKRHHAILHAAIATHQGYVFQIIGDAFCVAFHNASNAIEASISAQRALQVEAWDTTPLRIRMGLHTGTAEARDGEYQGYLTLARVQRMMSAAHGGQILVSAATAELVRGALPAGLALRDLGEHRLKGLLNPEHLWQLTAPALSQDFPPLQSLNAIPNNLPIQLTSFVGRVEEIAEVRQLLAGSRLVTLTGSGGTGKTRLSLLVAAEVLDQFPNGVWFVELAPLADPALVPHSVASVLGVREEPGRPMLATLLDWLRPKQLLLVLDNCEHLIEACAQFADAVLHASRATRILASSREALGIAGESAYHVPSLPSPHPRETLPAAELERYAAVQLFVERALAVKSSFALNSTNAPAVAQICHRLDGIPLAIELAAARIKVFAPEQIAARLDDRFRLLTGGSRTALPRQQTLRALIDWSYGLLSEPERILLRRLSVFAGGWTFDAAEAVCAGQGLELTEVLDLLTRLVDKSLVVTDEEVGETRYRMLETIRQYAREKLLEAGESEQLRDRHLEFILRLAERAEYGIRSSTDGAQWRDRMANELDNLRAALEGACEHDIERARSLAGLLRFCWMITNNMNEGLAWLERVLGPSEPAATTRGTALALLGAGVLCAVIPAYEEAQGFLERSVVALQALDDKVRLAEAVHRLGYTKTNLGQPADALALFEAHEAIIRQFADPTTLAWVLGTWGRAVANARGDYAAAKVLLDEALVVARRMGAPRVMGTIYWNLGFWTTQQGEYEAARRYHEAGLAWFRRDSDAHGNLGMALMYLADVVCLQGQYEEARLLYDEALALYEADGFKLRAAFITARLAYLAAQEGDARRAAALYAESLDIFRERADPRGIAQCLAGYGELWRLRGRVAQAVRLLASPALQPIASPRAALPVPRIEYERSVAAARAQLDEASFNAAWDAGSRLTLEQAIALALEETSA